MPSRIRSVRIQGFRSLADVEISDLPRVSVLLGANGAGKSNVLRFFEMMRRMLTEHRLARWVGEHGGADDQLFNGSDVTRTITAEVTVQSDAEPDCEDTYAFELTYAQPDRFIFSSEESKRHCPSKSISGWANVQGGYEEAELYYKARSERMGQSHQCARSVVGAFEKCMVFQYHDTAKFEKRWPAEDRIAFLDHGENLASVLLELQRHHPRRLERLHAHIRRVLPGFDRFKIEEDNGRVLLRWTAERTKKTFGPHLTSDGSLRFFALATLLNLPSRMLPDLILLDEPELGLHPAAIAMIAGMIKALPKDKQVIVATQSPLIVDAFGLENIIVLELKGRRTEIRKFDEDEYRHWLDEYSTGELWQKNLIGGRP